MLGSGRHRATKVALGLAVALVAAGTPLPAGAVVSGTTTRVSVSSDGTQGDRGGAAPDISADGRFVAFQSDSTDLVAGDDDPNNLRQDIFVHDRQTGATTRVSVASDGTPANNTSENAVMSGDGRFVAFSSTATNLVPGDTNGVRDVFVHDRQTAATSRVSVASGGAQAAAGGASPSISDDGNLVAFTSTANNLTGRNIPLTFQNVFVHDRQSGVTSQVSLSYLSGQEVAGSSGRPAISGSGRYVAFDTFAANVVPDDTNNVNDVFLHDRVSSTTSRISVASDGAQADGASESAAVSGDGSSVAFSSRATNLVAGDSNGAPDVFVREAGATTRVSVASDGSQAEPSAGNSVVPDISGDGRYVSFVSFAVLVPGARSSGQYLHNRVNGRTTQFNVATDGTHPDGNFSSDEISSLSGDGRYVAFDATATNLVANDTNRAKDVFVRDRKDLPAMPSVSVGDATVHEGDEGTRAAVFTVALSKPSTSTVTVDYATADDSALAPEYVAAAGTLSFAPGKTSLTVKVPVAGDTVDESHEVFDVVLSGPSGAYLGDNLGSGTILDDDRNDGGRRIAIGDVTVSEGDSGSRAAVFNVSLSGPLPISVTVTYTTVKDTATGNDFSAQSGTVTFVAGSTSAKVKVPITADTLREGQERFTVALSTSSSIMISDNSGQGTILDND